MKFHLDFQRSLAMKKSVSNMFPSNLPSAYSGGIIFLFRIITMKEEYMDKNPTNNTLVKRMITWALKEFNCSKFKSDIRMLDLWKLLVSC